jgi:hypothetical protein
VPDIGGVVLPSFYFSGAEVEGWWMGEKFDGVRAVWNPEKGNMYTKKGSHMMIPDCVADQMPSVFLDGEV